MNDALGSDADATGEAAPRSGVDGEDLRARVLRLERENVALSEQLAGMRARVEGTRRTLALLAQPALVPPAITDHRAHFASIAQALVATIADGCTIDVTTAEGLVPFAVAHREPAREVELRADQRDLSRVWERAVLRVPLSARNVTLGVMTVWSEDNRTLEPSELSLVHWLARHLAVLLENLRVESAAEEAARASDSLLSMVSHELRTPLATISMSVDTSIRRIEGSADELPKEWLIQRLEKAKKAVSRTDRLIHTFLGVSQICTGRLVPDTREVDLTALVKSVVHELSDELGWARCPWTLHAPGPQLGTWDPVQLEIVFNNLLTNAIKYAPGSAVDVRVDTDSKYVSVSVRDHGPGIAPEHRERLFQRYSRLPTMSRVNGFGLGLWIAKNFVEANGGTIRVESELGHGTTFTVQLPR